jgi:hypothetical protein
VEQFIELGHVVLQGAFPQEVANDVVHELGVITGCDLRDPATWQRESIWVKEAFSTPPFTDAITDRFKNAVNQLVGPDRWEPLDYMGWWPVTFPGCPAVDNWHLEGSFHHHVWSPEQALIPLFTFTDIRPGAGGTRLVERSHWEIARVLWEAEPEGLSADDSWKVIGDRLWPTSPTVIEAVAEAGDVVLVHPFVFHSSSANAGTGPRVMAQPRIDMTEPKRVDAPLHPVDLATATTRPSAG